MDIKCWLGLNQSRIWPGTWSRPEVSISKPTSLRSCRPGLRFLVKLDDVLLELPVTKAGWSNWSWA